MKLTKVILLSAGLSGCLFDGPDKVEEYEYQLIKEGQPWVTFTLAGSLISEDTVKFYGNNGSIALSGLYEIVKGKMEFVVKKSDSTLLPVSSRYIERNVSLNLRPPDSAYVTIVKNYTNLNNLVLPYVNNEKLTGLIEVDIFVNPEGKVDYVVCVQNTTKSRKIIGEIAFEISKWVFTKIESQYDQIVTLPITLKP